MSSPSGQQAPTTWTEPPWCGWIETTGDALLILEAARRGLIPRVTRRLVDSERKMITSGSVFVFDEDESGIKRWTDGFFWSPSRILGNFLLYRETDKKTSGRGRGNDMDVGDDGNSLSRPRESAQIGTEKLRERNLMGSLTNNYKFKSDGLMKKTFSLSIGGVAQHLISYYRVEDVENGRLRSPSSLPELASLSISPEYLDKTHFRNPPKVEMGPDGIPRYRGEADDVEIGTTRAPTLPPLTSNPPLLGGPRVETPGPKRSKRYDPYGQPASKRPRKQKSGSQGEDSPTATSPSSTEQLTSPTQSTTPPLQSPTAQTFPDSAAPHPPGYGYYPQHHMYHPYPHPSSPVPVNQQSSTSASTSPIYPPSGSVVPYNYDPNASATQQQQFVYSYYPAPPNFWPAAYYPQPQPSPSISAQQQQSPSSPVRAGSGGSGHTLAEKSQDDAAAAGGADG